MAAERQELPAYGIGPRFQNRNRKEEIRNLGANNARAASGHAAAAPPRSVMKREAEEDWGKLRWR